jgi:hypothetical protein
MKIGMGQSSAYTGAVSEVLVYYSNRINDRIEMETNLNIYYDVYKNSAYIKTWYDQSGSGRHAQQLSTSNQPTIVDAGTIVTENGKPCVKFDGVSSYMSYVGNVPCGSNMSVFAILKKVVHGGGGFFTLIPSSGNDYSTLNARAFHHGSSAGVMRIEGHSSVMPNSVDFSFSIPSSMFSISAIQSGGTFSARSNNSTLAIDTYSGTPTNPNGIALGCRYVNGGFSYLSNSIISEFILYGTNESSNRTSIENNMNSYYTLWN